MTTKNLIYITLACVTILFTNSCEDDKVAPQPSAIAGLVAKYSFDGDAKDAVGTNHGSVHGATLTTDRFGIANKAYSFVDGSNITLPNATELKSSAMTVSLWVKSTESGATNVGSNYIYTVINSPTNAYFAAHGLTLNTSDGKYFGVSQNGPSESKFGASLNAKSGNWQHYVLASSNDSLKMYIDGEKQWSIYKGFATTFTNDPIYIGVSGNTTYTGNLHGSVDDIRVYNRMLTNAEVKELFEE